MARETDMIYVFASDPGINTDALNGYAVGNDWKNSSTGEVFTCTDDTTGAAVWNSVTNSITGTINTVAGAIVISPDAILTPPVIIANQEDYSPVGFVVAGVVKKSFLILTPDFNWLIGGLQPPSPALGNRITILNNSSFNLTLRNNWPISTAEYRFLSGQNIILQGFEAIDFIYSTSLLRWVAITK